MPYLATFDAGTTAVKGVLVAETGEIALSRSVEIPTVFRGEWKEQDPETWWEAFQIISRAFAAAVDPAEITGIAMSGQMQDLIPLNEGLQPVCGAVLYSDGRAEEEARRLAETVGEGRFLEITGNRCDGSLPLPKLMWLKEQRPALYARTRHVLISSKDYLIAKLTGVCCGDVTACATAGAMDIRRRCWDPELLRAAGVPAELFPKLCLPHQQAGAVREDAAEACGYRPGTPVFAGIGDAGATTLASGIARPGQFNINLGTSGWVATVSGDVLLTESGVFNLAAATPGNYINVVPFLNAGNVHRWISGVLTAPEHQGDIDYPAMTALLEDSVPGSHGALFLPYLAGERFPVLDSAARGCYVGLTPETTAADLARACLEGVAFSLRQGLEQLAIPPETVSVIGGGGREACWCQILADVLGLEIAAFRNAEYLPSLAVAAIALVGMGKHPSYETFTDGLRQPESCVLYRPRQEYRQMYDGLYDRYRRLYPALRSVFQG